jgi:myosin-light-chain kinase
MGCGGSKPKEAAKPASAPPPKGDAGSSSKPKEVATTTNGVTVHPGGEKLLDKYVLGKVLGQGAFGVVYSCKAKGSKQEYAVKMIDKVETPLEEIKEEVRMLQMLTHPAVIRLHDVYYEKVFVCMVMDVYKGGDLIEGMQNHWKTKGMIPIKVVQLIGKQMIDGIVWLHSKNVVHRDVKGDNYLMDRKMLQDPKCKVFLSDFGTVTQINAGERMNKKCGTQIYWSPEFFNMNYSLKVDIWALGVVMFGLISGRFPFKGEESVKKSEINIPSRCPKDGSAFLKKMLMRDEGHRFSADEAIAHPFIASVATEEEKVKTEENFNPEVKESGAHAGIAQRRAELVERMENQGDETAASQTDKSGFNRSEFQIDYKREERSSKFAWWDATRSKELVNFAGAKQAQESDIKSNAEASADGIKAMLKDYGVKTDKFGMGQAKTFHEFQMELQGGSAILMLDASKHKEAVRVVEIVLVRICFGSGAEKRYLVQTAEKFPDGREKTDVNQLPGTKKEPYENSVATAKRVCAERLNMANAKIQFSTKVKERFEEDEASSTSYPGVRTVYRKEIIEGLVTASDPAVLEAIGTKKAVILLRRLQEIHQDLQLAHTCGMREQAGQIQGAGRPYPGLSLGCSSHRFRRGAIGRVFESKQRRHGEVQRGQH